MTQKQVIDVEAQEVAQEQGPQVIGEIHIKLLDNGGIELNVPETSKEFKPDEIEQILQNVSNQLRDTRVAQLAVDMFKQRLG